MGLKSSENVAIDIGSYAIKGTVINSSKELVKFATVPTPKGAIEGGIIRNPDEIAAGVLQVWKGLNVKTTNIISTVPGQHVFVRQLTLPAMKKKELDQAVRFQAEGQIPIPASEVVLDYAIISENKTTKQIDVLVVATRKSVVQQLIHIFSQAKLTPKAFELESLALARVLLKSNKKKVMSGSDVIASVGAENTHISMFEGDIPRFTRSIPFGGGRFTRSLAVERSIGLEEAERAKLSGELPDEADTLLQDFTSEVKRSIDYFQSQNKEQMIKQIILAGGGANLGRLADYLSNRMNLPVLLGNPSEQVKIPKKLSQPDNIQLFKASLAPCLGLALRGLK
jgi:type IV pilus assembly protein PilM